VEHRSAVLQLRGCLRDAREQESYAGERGAPDREEDCHPMPFRKSSADAQKKYRDSHPAYQVTEAMRVKARYRAMAELARRYPKIYRRLYAAELEKLRREEK